MRSHDTARRHAVARISVLVATAVILVLGAAAQFTGDQVPTDLLDLSAAPYDPTTFPDRNIADAVASADGDDDATTRLLERLTPFAAETLDRPAFDDISAVLAGAGLRVEGVIERAQDLTVVLIGSDQGRFVLAIEPAASDAAQINGILLNPLPPIDGGPVSDVEFVFVAATMLLLVGVGLARPAGGGRYVATGLLTGLAVAELAPWQLLQDVGVLAVPAALVVATTTLTDERVPLAVIGASAVAALLSLLPVTATDPGAVARPWGHLVRISSLQGHVEGLQQLAGVAAIVAAGVVWWWLATGRRRSDLFGRTAVSWRLVGTHLACVSIVVVAVTGLARPAGLDLTASGWVVGALLAVGAGRAGQLLQRRAALADVSARVADLSSARDQDVSTVIGRALDDPTVRVLHRRRDGGRDDGWVLGDGHPAELPLDPRSFTLLVLDGETVGAVTHSPRVSSDPDRLRVACDAVTLSLANERLAAEIRSRLDDVRASRQRVLEAEDRARVRLERDLHDGAQQRLTAAMLQLRVAQQVVDRDLAVRLAPIGDELQRAIDEIRELARGVRPSALDAGLGAAAEDLAERAPLPVTVHDRLPRRVEPALETAAWFVLNEAVVNAGRHARATHVEITLSDEPGVNGDTGGDGAGPGHLVITVTDDGAGIDPALEVAPGRRPAGGTGTGLVSLFDRADALGGTLSVRRGQPCGTIVEVRLPCGP